MPAKATAAIHTLTPLPTAMGDSKTMGRFSSSVTTAALAYLYFAVGSPAVVRRSRWVGFFSNPIHILIDARRFSLRLFRHHLANPAPGGVNDSRRRKAR
jgi:hypothetical protein